MNGSERYQWFTAQEKTEKLSSDEEENLQLLSEHTWIDIGKTTKLPVSISCDNCKKPRNL